MTELWKYLDLPGWEQQVEFLLKWTDQNRIADQDDFQRWHRSEVEFLPEFKDHFKWWKQWGIIPNEMFVIRTPQNDIKITDVNDPRCPRIHQDHKFINVGDFNLNGFEPQYSINFPLKDCSNTYTHFFEIVDTSKDPWVPYYGNESGADPRVCKEISQYHLIKPIIMRVKVPHCIHNPNPTLRQVICFRFENDSQLDHWIE
jgi:hypothetical protein